MRLSHLLTAAALTFALVKPVVAQDCVGRNLLDDLPPAQLAQIESATRAVPFNRGLFWQASKGEQRITLIGTYHFPDPRHDPVLARFGPRIDQADALLVEAGPEEGRQLSEAMAKDPSLIMNAQGPTLPELMPPAEWSKLATAMEARGMPAIIASRMRPWYVSMLLAISPCEMETVRATGDAGGLDQRLIDRAEGAGVPVLPLESWNTIFTMFEGMTLQQEIDMIRVSMPAAEHADDYTVTLADAYFSGETWLIWEFGRLDSYESSGLPPAEVDRQMLWVQEKLMDQRNHSWIAPLEDAAARAAGRGKGIVAAFGALHLPGENGVLTLLQRQGWTIEPIETGEEAHGG